ncbi:IclR family transcriptional regulator [Rhizobium sp.]|uniref:IclR family transcriptional regulator n=1 Tax=Rhizobium sp. TaxID=391 RepID=UPI002EE775D7
MSSLEDAVAILACFSLEEPALTQAELTRRVGRPKATVSRVMRSLRESGILDFEPTRRLYSPGLRLFELGQICRSNHNFLETIQKRLEDICRIGGHTGYITVFDGAEMVVLRIVRGSSPLAIATGPGYRMPPHATSNGRAMLALLSDHEWRRRVPDPLPFVSPNCPPDHEALLKLLQSIRATGRSFSSNETLHGVSSQGIALRDPESGEIIGVAISYPESMATDELNQMIGNLLDQMKSELTRRGNAI